MAVKSKLTAHDVRQMEGRYADRYWCDTAKDQWPARYEWYYAWRWGVLHKRVLELEAEERKHGQKK